MLGADRNLFCFEVSRQASRFEFENNFLVVCHGLVLGFRKVQRPSLSDLTACLSLILGFDDALVTQSKIVLDRRHARCIPRCNPGVLPLVPRRRRAR